LPGSVEKIFACARLNLRVAALALTGRWLDEKAVAASYDQAAEGYDKSWLSHLRSVTDTLLSQLPRPEPGAVLDLGCGPGNLLEKLRGVRIVGVDISANLLDQARRRVARRAHVELLAADAQALPLAPSSFDRLVCSELLEHVLDPSRVIAEIHRVCRPGARVVFTVPNEKLINLTKRLVLALGLRKLVAGDYAMSENMLNAWHLRQVSRRWLSEACAGRFRALACWSVPALLAPYHHVLALEVEK